MFKNKKKYQKLSISPDEFLGITRMETKMGDWRTVKKHCRTRNLRDILNLENVNYLILSKIINGQPRDIPKGDLGHFKKVSALKNYSLAFVLNEHCGGDIRLISNEIKHRLGKNTKASYQMKKIRKMLPLAQNLEGRKMDAIFAIKNLLKDK